MNGYQKGRRMIALAIALVMLFGIPGSMRSVRAEETRGMAGYYLVGSMNGWAVNADDRLTENPGQTGEYWITLDLTAGADPTEAKAGDTITVTIDTWYPATGANYNVDSAHAGSCVIYFRPAYGGGSDWYQNCIYVRKLENEFYLVRTAETPSARTTSSTSIKNSTRTISSTARTRPSTVSMAPNTSIWS